MSYYQESIDSIEKILEQTIPSSGIEGAFGRFYVEEWLDKPFDKLLDPSYDESRVEIDKMDYCFSVVLAYRYGIEKEFIPKYAIDLFNKLDSSGYFKTLLGYLNDEDAQSFKQDLESVRQYRSKHA
jgi:hypothetical protein